MLKRLATKPLTWVLAVALLGAAAFGGYWFQPWKLLTDTVVDEAVPVVEQPLVDPATPEPDATPQPDGSPPATVEPSPSPASNQLIASGEFVTHEHETTGTAQLIRLAEGGHQLVLRDFATSNGPDLRVWLSDQPVLEGRAGWFVFDDGAWAELDRLKGNQGNQVYDIPDDVDLTKLTSVSIWCKRFAVSFGAADLTP